MSKKILVLDGHPAEGTFCGALAEHYAQGATKAGHEVRVQQLSKMAFDPNLGVAGFSNTPPLEEDLEAFWESLVWCDHVVISHPLWWGGMPAKLKGLFDRVLLSGKAFKYIKGKDLPAQLLKGRSARVLLTSDTPRFYLKWLYGHGVKKQTERQILKFCGIRPKGYSQFASMIKSTPEQRGVWLRSVEGLGAKAA